MLNEQGAAEFKEKRHNMVHKVSGGLDNSPVEARGFKSYQH